MSKDWILWFDELDQEFPQSTVIEIRKKMGIKQAASDENFFLR